MDKEFTIHEAGEPPAPPEPQVEALEPPPPLPAPPRVAGGRVQFGDFGLADDDMVRMGDVDGDMPSPQVQELIEAVKALTQALTGQGAEAATGGGGGPALASVGDAGTPTIRDIPSPDPLGSATTAPAPQFPVEQTSTPAAASSKLPKWAVIPSSVTGRRREFFEARNKRLLDHIEKREARFRKAGLRVPKPRPGSGEVPTAPAATPTPGTDAQKPSYRGNAPAPTGATAAGPSMAALDPAMTELLRSMDESLKEIVQFIDGLNLNLGLG